MKRIALGDLIFQVLETLSFGDKVAQHEQQFNEAVSQSAFAESADFIPVNHVALVISDSQVIEATAENGVVVTDLSIFLTRATKNIVARVKESVLIEPAIQRAKTWLGADYNASFYSDHQGFYCSELITEAFVDFEKKPYFQLHPMNFKAITGEVLSYWVDYYQKLNLPIPHGMLGSHPEQLLQQKRLFSDIFFVKA